MKKFIPAHLLFLLCGCAGGETQPAIGEAIENPCVYRVKYTAENLKTIFPFNKAKKIKLVSFETGMEDSAGLVELRSFIPMYFTKGRDKSSDSSTIQELEWKESVYLSESAQTELAGIIFNYNSSIEGFAETRGACYWPRNGIIFYDSLNKAYAGYEICFDCSGIVTHPYGMSYGDKCDEKMKMIQDFFVSKGIKYVSEH